VSPPLVYPDLSPVKGVRTFTVKNPSEALYLCKCAIEKEGTPVETRNGSALEFDTPVAITYNKPRERVLFYAQRDANPVFHLMESLWMLQGRNDVEWISQFNGRINTYSDDGAHFHGAYGYRWKTWFKKDQLEHATHRLLTYKNDRRTVLTMWDPHHDLVKTNDGKDYPCNTQIFLKKRDNYLDMTVINRSNDMIWGALGANAVHMSFLQEYMAAKTGTKVGIYTQFSNNLHVYLDTLEKLNTPQPLRADYDAYGTRSIKPQPLVDDIECFNKELELFFKVDPITWAYYDWTPRGSGSSGRWVTPLWKNSFFPGVALPMLKTWQLYKKKDLVAAREETCKITSPDWAIALREWLDRRRIRTHAK